MGFALSIVLGSSLPLITRLILNVQDESAASRRIDSAFAILEQPAELCGYGMPKNPDAYRRGFGVAGVAPFNWQGAMSIGNISIGSTVRKDALCRIAYGTASGIRSKAQATASGGRFDILLSGDPHLLDPTSATPNRIKNWALFGSMTPSHHPFRLERKNTTTGGCEASARITETQGQTEITIPRNDELFYLRALELRVKRVTTGSEVDYVLYADDCTGSGSQPRAGGVIDMRFKLVGERLLRVWVLARGDTKYSRIAAPGAPEGWPPEYSSDIPEEMRYYRLFSATRSFELMNM